MEHRYLKTTIGKIHAAMAVPSMLIVLIGFCSVGKVHGFNWERCETIINKSSIQGEGVFTSTSGYSSSTGECSMVGKSDHDTKAFYVDNKQKVIDDITRGQGEYLKALLKIMSCTPIEYKIVTYVLKNNFGNLMVMDTKNQYKFIKSQCKKFCWANSFDMN